MQDFQRLLKVTQQPSEYHPGLYTPVLLAIGHQIMFGFYLLLRCQYERHILGQKIKKLFFSAI